jgi:hypothetical protein
MASPVWGWLNHEVTPKGFDFGSSVLSGVGCLAIAVANLLGGFWRVGAEFGFFASLAFLTAWRIRRDAWRSTPSKPSSE